MSRIFDPEYCLFFWCYFLNHRLFPNLNFLNKLLCNWIKNPAVRIVWKMFCFHVWTQQTKTNKTLNRNIKWFPWKFVIVLNKFDTLFWRTILSSNVSKWKRPFFIISVLSSLCAAENRSGQLCIRIHSKLKTTTYPKKMRNEIISTKTSWTSFDPFSLIIQWYALYSQFMCSMFNAQCFHFADSFFSCFVFGHRSSGTEQQKS